jgi:hypothetical protein
VSTPRPLRVLTWHVHGGYLYYLAHCGHTIYLPVGQDRGSGYGGLNDSYAWPANVREIPAESVHETDLDVVLFQSRRNWEVDRFEILSDGQLRGPRVYVEHDPPRGHPTDTRHPVDDPGALLVHVTSFNALMWDSGRTPVRVVDHGIVVPPDVLYRGELERGIVVVNDLASRGRRLGRDLFEALRTRVPLDLVGIASHELGGIGEVVPSDVPRFVSRYRVFFHPARYTSLGLAVLEAMAVGLPVVGLATTELVTVIENGVNGYIATDPEALVEPMHRLLADPAHALRVGEAGRRTVTARFGIERFARDWDSVLREAVATGGR